MRFFFKPKVSRDIYFNCWGTLAVREWYVFIRPEFSGLTSFCSWLYSEKRRCWQSAMAKSWNAWVLSSHPAFMGNYLTTSQYCHPYLPSRWVHNCVPSIIKGNADALWMQDFTFFLFAALIKGMRRCGESEIFLFNHKGGNFLIRPPTSRVV